MAYSEFYCDPTSGLNANGGSETAAATFTDASASWDGSAVITTAVATTNVVAGQFANVGGSYIARVLSKDATHITLSTTSKAGSAPGSGTRATTVGGPFKGPNGADGLPLTLATLGAATNSNGDMVRVNLINNANFAITANVAIAAAGPYLIQGCTASGGDGGRATIDGGTPAASFVLWTITGAQVMLADLIFQRNGSAGTGTAVGVSVATGGRCTFHRCTFNTTRDAGISITIDNNLLVECEAYGCNVGNGSGVGGFLTTKAATFIRCTAHDNVGTNTDGFAIGAGSSGSSTLVDCIADSNGLHGFANTSTGGMYLINCVAYNNGVSATGDGARQTASGPIYIENCIFSNNTGYGFRANSATAALCLMQTNAFLSNTADTLTINASLVLGSITLSGQAMTDPANGDFSLDTTTGEGAACRGAGRCTFTLAAGSYSGTTTAHLDIGAVQHADPAAVSTPMNVGIRTGGRL